MKKIIYILTFLILANCGQSDPKQEIKIEPVFTSTNDNSKSNNGSLEDNKDEIEDKEQSVYGFEKATLFKLTDTIKADFNGDGINDKAFFKKENETSGIVIYHGKTNEEFRIGFGEKFSTWTELDCNWVDYWGLVEDKQTSETVFGDEGDVEGSQLVKLQNLSIVIGEDEIGGGLITFKNGKYIWIHQTC